MFARRRRKVQQIIAVVLTAKEPTRADLARQIRDAEFLHG